MGALDPETSAPTMKLPLTIWRRPRGLLNLRDDALERRKLGIEIQYSSSKLQLNQFIHSDMLLGRVVRKLVNVNPCGPGLKVNRSSNFSSIKMLSISYILCILRLYMLKTEGQEM